MSIRKIFVDWSRPALPAVVEDLLSRRPSGQEFDFTDLTIVFPGRSAGRRFLELLTIACEGRVCPPRIFTVGQLPELLYHPQRAFASPLVQRMAWAQVLRALPESELLQLLRRPPSQDHADAWLNLGDLLRRQHAELAAEGLNFADVAERGPELEGFDEVGRWNVLAHVQREYLQLLDGLNLWDQQTARLVAVQRQECQLDHELITVGTVDLNNTMRAMLDQVAPRVTMYLHAPPNWAGYFDDYGGVDPEKWADVPVDLNAEQIEVADDLAAQANSVLSTLEKLDGGYALDEISIGVLDDEFRTLLQRLLEQWGIPAFWPVSRLLREAEPFRLLEALGDYLQSRSIAAFSALIRHPVLTQWIDSHGIEDEWMTAWDAYCCEHFPLRTTSIPDAVPDEALPRRLIALVDGLFRDLLSGKAPCSAWEEKIRDLWLALYGDRVCAADDEHQLDEFNACRGILEGFASFADLPSELDERVTAAEAIRLTLDEIGDEAQTRRDPGESILLSGWLEMPLDDAPVAIVTSFNEGLVPSSINHDLFLPNRLRAHLGIEDNARRYARDCFTLQTLLHSREKVRLIACRRNSAGDPMIPSRLLFAAEAEEIARRVEQFFGRDSEVAAQSWFPWSPAAEGGFSIPRPLAVQHPRTIFRATEFRDYLASPYRYYLRHVLQLVETGDPGDELDGAAFGVLLHDVLWRFGQDECQASTSADEIRHWLGECLDRLAEWQFGNQPMASVRVQIEQARRRLARFAEWQADWRRQGWEILTVEKSSAVPAPFTLPDGRTFSVTGRIDRIDVHRQTGEWALFDYKTGDSGADPQKAHRWHDQWIDLQLPLYRHLARQMGAPEALRLGYIILPRDIDKISAVFADWSESELSEADDVVRRVAEHILNEEFWLELESPSGMMTEMDSICQSAVFGQEAVL